MHAAIIIITIWAIAQIAYAFYLIASGAARMQNPFACKRPSAAKRPTHKLTEEKQQ